jgi:hypothetical protein
MLGICPNCKISLKDNDDKDRDTNEVMLVLRYRELVDKGIIPRSVEELGYCELCNAKKQDFNLQKAII